LTEERAIFIERGTRWMIRAPHDLFAVGAVKRAAVVARRVREPPRHFAALVHLVEIEIAVTHRREDDLAALMTPRCFGVVAGRSDPAAAEDKVVCRIDRPDVAFRPIRR